ncbi:unnamed protein product [Ectocarpus sp. 6 AP-2014]
MNLRGLSAKAKCVCARHSFIIGPEHRRKQDPCTMCEMPRIPSPNATSSIHPSNPDRPPNNFLSRIIARVVDKKKYQFYAKYKVSSTPGANANFHRRDSREKPNNIPEKSTDGRQARSSPAVQRER